MARTIVALGGLVAALAVAAGPAPGSETATCKPTPADALGPFYEPGAPLRTKVGTGYVLTGTVRSARNCRPIAGARVEFWLANPAGQYDDDHRATIRVGRLGKYRFESNRPVPYSGRPPHIHVRVSAARFQTLVTQHYPKTGQTRATFDLVLRPR